MSYPENVGILAVEIYFPKRCIDQAKLEKYDGVSAGKYTIGLGQTKMGFCDDREDINSIALTVVQNLIEKYKISYKDIGRVEVGTETIIDKSKSVKSVIMQLFKESGNTDVDGIDTTNACYGGTSALFNALNWIESSSWDGRYALVIAGDIAVYASGPARPTGGAGCVALLIGKDAPIVFDRGLRGIHMEHVWDFYKPDLTSEFPEVDGHLSNACYLKSLDTCYNRFMTKLITKEKVEKPTVNFFDYMLFHTPYCKLVQKSYARLFYDDFVRNPEDPCFKSVQHFKDMSVEESLRSKDLEKAFMELSKPYYEKKVKPTLLASTQVGNMYCASLYSTLASLLSNVPADDLTGKRVGMFSYGSGLASSFFSFQIKKSVADISKILDVPNRLKSRLELAPEKFSEVMKLREELHGQKGYVPLGDGSSTEDAFFSGTYYLEQIDSKWRRSYKRTA
ncbi:4291_t:CDS:10 [Funneliformis geosporum]|uniref:Hydroxymethylglutaryl-CoA synthase n=1 Tax=Funneliformis geosporum TaxID=1117311 RepID=A0A9W4WVS9_9GLOM|nr:4291_t:CDS:10 [Funneliformis geosporum]CAI2190483.1 9580_t:CDS:10 [Funneliformis geosporum]